MLFTKLIEMFNDVKKDVPKINQAAIKVHVKRGDTTEVLDIDNVTVNVTDKIVCIVTQENSE